MSLNTMYLSLATTLLLFSVASATRDDDTYTISTAQPRTDQHRNECMGDSVNGNCVGSDQADARYSYDLMPNDEASKETIDRLDVDDPVKYVEDTHDYLSERDQVIYKSKDSSFWKASDQDTLRQVLFVHRHGDRTPISFSPRDNFANEPFWQFHGLGQLTNRGKARLHMLGKIIRQRYNTFLNGSVNKNFRKTRASGSLRCIESAQVFLSSFLSLNTTKSPDAKLLVWDKNYENELAELWQPASVLTLAAKYDGLLNEGAECKALNAEYVTLDNAEESKRLMVEFKNVAEVLKREIDFDIDHFYKWFWAGSQLEVERSYFEKKMKPGLLAIYDRLQKASDRALVIFQSSHKLRRLRAGLLINDILENMKEIRESSQSMFTKKFVQYSAHDVNLIFLLGLLDSMEKVPYRPDYASNMAFELHQDNDEWFIKIYYMPHVPSKPLELHVEACEEGHAKSRCTLDKFTDLMEKYRVSSWMNWMQECGNSLTSVNPYEQNS